MSCEKGQPDAPTSPPSILRLPPEQRDRLERLYQNAPHDVQRRLWEEFDPRSDTNEARAAIRAQQGTVK